MDVKRKVDIIRVNPQDWPDGTPAWKEENPELGHDIIPAERYTSTAFMKLEWERMWTKVWLLGGRSDDIPEPGDYICTEIGHESILIVRQHDGSVRAFPNVCLHRGNRLRPEGIGNAAAFQCMYHHWTYDLGGKICRIPDLDTFPQGAPAAGGLPSLPCAEWGSFVWFSLDPDVGPLADFLAPMQRHLAPYHIERMAWVRDITVEWDCNWKAAVDAFSEVYHVQGIHPQLQWYLDDTSAQIDVYGRHSRYLVPFATVSRARRAAVRDPARDPRDHGQGPHGPADYEGRVSDILLDVQRFKRAHGPAQGKDYADLNDDQLTDDYHYSLFPNVSLNVHADDVMMFACARTRPIPDKMLYDIWMFELVPDGEPRPERPKHKRFRHGDRTIGTVLDRMRSTCRRGQKGMRIVRVQGPVDRRSGTAHPRVPQGVERLCVSRRRDVRRAMRRRS